MGLGNRPNAAQTLDSDEEEELFRSGAFGPDNPDSLLSAMWYMNTVHFGMRGTHEHRQLKWGDIQLETDSDGRRKLVYNERLTKTRDGTNTKNTRAYAPTSWDNPEDESKCHVALYVKYRSQRPENECKEESPFYLGVNRMQNAKHWFKSQPLGEKQLKSLMKCAVGKSTINKNKKKITNHSGRKTAITRLLDEGIPITSVKQHSGHKSLASLNNYAKNSSKTQKKMSSILNRNNLSIGEQTMPDKSKASSTVEQMVPDKLKASCTEPKEMIKEQGFSNLFPAGTVINGGTFNLQVFFGSNKENTRDLSVKPKKRKFVIESDSDSD